MPNAKAVRQELLNYICARTPLVIISTNERERVERIIREISSSGKQEIWYYTDARQVRIYGRNDKDGTARADAGGDPLSFFLDKVKKSRGVTAVLGDVRRISEDNLYSHQLMNLLYTAREMADTIVLVTGDPVWARIASFGMMTSLDLPDTGERIEQVEKFVDACKGTCAVEWDANDVIRVAAVLRGFSEVQIDNLLSAEIAAHKALKKDRIMNLGDQKQRLYGAIGAVQYIRSAGRIEAAGMENLKAWLEEKKNVFFAPEDLLRKYDLKAPKGILLVGVPGCGKSMTARLVAGSWGLPLFRFDIGSVFDKWVGESEKKMREALAFIDHVAPCVLWIDEIEKVLSSSEGSNEAGRRVLGEFLFWIQETDSRVFMVATANHVDQLPYELYRKGRFSEVFFADLPAEKERAAAFLQYIKRSLHQEPDAELIRALVGLSAGFSYADIETAVKDVAQDALGEISRYGAVLNPEGWRDRLMESVKEIIPISRINPDMVEMIRRWGRQRARNVSAAEEE